jgi:hypothetical protein
VRERADGRALGWVQATVHGATASIAYALLAAERRRVPRATRYEPWLKELRRHDIRVRR